MNQTPTTGTLKCFVCGRPAVTLDELKRHLHDEHVYEKEYLTCQQCGVPIRDAAIHYRASHPTLKVQGGPARVAVLYSWDGKGKRVKARGRRMQWKDGNFFSEKNQQLIHYRSSWELKVMKILEASVRVESYRFEPFSISYLFNGERCGYIPDFLVKFKDGTLLLLEIKPQNQCDDARNKAKWTAALEYAESHRITFRIWTEIMIDKLNRIGRDPQALTETIMCA